MSGPIDGWDARPGVAPVTPPPGSGWTIPTPTKRSRLGIAELFEEAFTVWRHHFRPIFVVHLIFQVPLLIVTFVPLLVSSRFAALAPRTSFGRPVVPTRAEIQAVLDLVPLLLASSLAIVVLAPLLAAFALAGPSYIAGRARRGDSPTIRETLSALRRLIRPIVGYSVALLALAVGVVLAFAIGVVILLLLGRLPRVEEVAVLVVVIATIVGIVAMLIALIRVQVAIPALVHARLGGRAALRRTWALVGGSVLHTAIVLLVVGFIVSLAPGIVVSVLTPTDPVRLAADPLAAVAPAMLVQLVTAAALGPLYSLVLTALYFDLADADRR
jgi:hypothetical protein